ncbi:hypothetical protein [Streptomyces sp. NPDC002758]
MIPLFAIGVFIGFTISQIGLVRHWAQQRPSGWLRRAALNGVGVVLTTVAGLVLPATKFLESVALSGDVDPSRARSRSWITGTRTPSRRLPGMMIAATWAPLA